MYTIPVLYTTSKQYDATHHHIAQLQVHSSQFTDSDLFINNVIADVSMM